MLYERLKVKIYATSVGNNAGALLRSAPVIIPKEYLILHLLSHIRTKSNVKWGYTSNGKVQICATLVGNNAGASLRSAPVMPRFALFWHTLPYGTIKYPRGHCFFYYQRLVQNPLSFKFQDCLIFLMKTDSENINYCRDKKTVEEGVFGAKVIYRKPIRFWRMIYQNDRKT